MTADELASLHAAAFAHDRSWSAEEFATLLSQKGTHLIGDTHSFVLIRVTLDEAEVLTLATDPSHRRQGLARATLTKAETTALTAGATRMFLELAEDNAAAASLYAGLSYRQVGRRPGYYPRTGTAPVAALVLQKDISPP